jgi:hypothetical protein
MRLVLDTSEYVFEVSRAPEAKVDRKTGAQQQDKMTGRLKWTVQLYVKGQDGGEIINVTVAGDQPKLTLGQPVAVKGLEVIPWVGDDGKSRTAFRAELISSAPAVKAA